MVLRPTSPPLRWGVTTAAVLIAVEVGIVHLLKQISPENAFGAVFLFGVLVVSAGWGFRLTVATSVASTGAYTWFHVQQSSESSFAPAVVVFLALALLTNLLVGQSRLRALESEQRRGEADLSAALARTVLRAADRPAALAAASARLSEVLELPPPGAVLGEADAPCGPRQRCIPLFDDDRPIGSLVVPIDLAPADRRRVDRMIPGLEALMAAACDREELYGRTIALARQQAALRRVATLVAARADLGEIYPAIAAELADELGVEHISLVRFDTEGYCVVLAARDDTAGENGLVVGERLPLGGANVSTRVAETGKAAVVDYADATGPIADRLHERGIRSGIGVPITVEGRTWGAIIVGATQRPALPDLRLRLVDFADLVSTAVYNSESRTALTRSRARVIAAADHARRAIERDLHDGAQQRLVALGLDLRAAQAAVPEDQPALRRQLDDVVDSLSQVHTDLQELSRGIHPAILSRGGLSPALKTLARRSSVPTVLSASVPGRLPEPVEVTAYYVVAEALTNTAKYAQACEVLISAHLDGDWLLLSVTDDGVGGACPENGSGLVGLRDRVEAVEGEFTVVSPPGAGTTVSARIPAAGSRSVTS
ncbi:GAF domain-containing protein [Nocardia testacea]|uniref:GAF domain-containing protein n=1 Tax=Nocardia testacea TaxID=248551 RepID=UPI0033CCF74D